MMKQTYFYLLFCIALLACVKHEKSLDKKSNLITIGNKDSLISNCNDTLDIKHYPNLKQFLDSLVKIAFDPKIKEKIIPPKKWYGTLPIQNGYQQTTYHKTPNYLIQQHYVYNNQKECLTSYFQVQNKFFKDDTLRCWQKFDFKKGYC